VSVANGRIALGDTADGQQSAIGYALEDVLRQETGKRLLGIILASDGAPAGLSAPRRPSPDRRQR